ncbi:MAG: DHH family phosphoesterase [Planctomycetota bacterium]
MSDQVDANLRSQALLDLLHDRERVLIVMHDNPDPDALASAWALQTLLQAMLGRESRMVAGGAIVRAENRRMVDLLDVPVQLVLNIEEGAEAAVILVDCGSTSNNQLLSRSGMQPLAIIDHHANSCGGQPPPFADLRPQVAATATIAADYLRQQSVEPDARLATALLYAVRTETRGSETSYSPIDSEMVVWLTERADAELLAEIENARLSKGWYSDLVLAMQCTALFDDAALCFLPTAEGPEIVGEVADLLIRCEGVRRVLCAALIAGDLLISVRTAKGAEDASDLVVAVIGKLGSGGGHRRRAGGKIPEVVNGAGGTPAVEQQIRTRWLDACGVCDQPPQQLVSWRDIVEHI